MSYSRWTISLVSVLVFGMPATVVAQSAKPAESAPMTNQEGDTLTEIVVTAEKRTTDLQKTPISITALGGEALLSEQVHDLPDLTSLVPSFQMGEVEGYAQITIRGIGISNFVPAAESAVAVNLNEVYISRPIAQLTGLYDVAAVEVLRGPQGTLYGRNATAGAVNITTQRPSDSFTGYGDLTIGNYGETRVEGAVGGPLTNDELLVRFAGFREVNDGYGKNLVTGNDIDNKDAYGGRVTVVFRPVDEFQGIFIVEDNEEHDHSSALHYFGAAGLLPLAGTLGKPPVFVQLGGYTAQNPLDIANGIDPTFMLRTTAETAILEWSPGAFSLRSITGFRQQNSLTSNSLDGGMPLSILFRAGEPDRQFSEEIQAHYDTERLHLTAGLYYFHELDDYAPAYAPVSNVLLNLDFPDLPLRPTEGFTDFANLGGLIDTNAKAAFSQASFEVAPGLSLTGGIRYSVEGKHLFQQYRIDLYTPYTGDNPLPPAVSIPSKTFYSTTPRLGIQYDIDPHTAVYGTYAKGFKSGGFDPGTDPSVVARGFQPEKLTDYEVGVKSDLLDNHVRLNLSGFYYDYTDLQVSESVALTIATANAASAHVYGVEAELTAVVSRALTIEGNASWLHARFVNYSGPDNARPLLTSVNYDGNSLDNAPDWSAHLGPNYRWALPRGTISLKGEGDYSSKFFFTPANLPLVGQSSFFKANAFLTYDSNAGWHVTGFVRNLTNKLTRVSADVEAVLNGTPVQGSYAPPRTYGAEVGYRF